ncbi:hypothetical protein TNCV_1075601 [Trichonephila clavipes]|uniref:Uncharacterized protein n=1 Tax=Trichonephila clavipes TaxID=2585209 RepID=A0A8X6VRE9_TRICX|nr:hypothetical protein TNCV_1075601 [Trichonephila clavipes]
MALYRSPLTVTLWPSSFLMKYGPMIQPAHKAHQTVSFSGLLHIVHQAATTAETINSYNSGELNGASQHSTMFTAAYGSTQKVSEPHPCSEGPSLPTALTMNHRISAVNYRKMEESHLVERITYFGQSHRRARVNTQISNCIRVRS